MAASARQAASPSAADRTRRRRTEWLSQGLEALLIAVARRRLARERRGLAPEPDFDVIIVGSGYGAAIAAAELSATSDPKTGKRTRVCVLERGREYLPGAFPSRLKDLGGHVRYSHKSAQPKGQRSGLFDVRPGADLNVLVASRARWRVADQRRRHGGTQARSVRAARAGQRRSAPRRRRGDRARRSRSGSRSPRGGSARSSPTATAPGGTTVWADETLCPSSRRMRRWGGALVRRPQDHGGSRRRCRPAQLCQCPHVALHSLRRLHDRLQLRSQGIARCRRSRLGQSNRGRALLRRDCPSHRPRPGTRLAGPCQPYRREAAPAPIEAPRSDGAARCPCRRDAGVDRGPASLATRARLPSFGAPRLGAIRQRRHGGRRSSRSPIASTASATRRWHLTNATSDRRLRRWSMNARVVMEWSFKSSRSPRRCAAWRRKRLRRLTPFECSPMATNRSTGVTTTTPAPSDALNPERTLVFAVMGEDSADGSDRAGRRPRSVAANQGTARFTSSGRTLRDDARLGAREKRLDALRRRARAGGRLLSNPFLARPSGTT